MTFNKAIGNVLLVLALATAGACDRNRDQSTMPAASAPPPTTTTTTNTTLEDTAPSETVEPGEGTFTNVVPPGETEIEDEEQDPDEPGGTKTTEPPPEPVPDPEDPADPENPGTTAPPY